MIVWPTEIEKCKYRDWYEQLVEGAQNRIFTEDEYGENHHIIPRSLGGTNDPSNVVRLFPREHYIAHLLLWKMKMTAKMHNKMTMALHVMVNGSGNAKQNRSYLVPSRIYEQSRKAYSKLLSEERKGSGNSFYGKKHTPETIEKIKEANVRTRDIRSAKLSGENNGMYGKTHTDEVRKIISDSVKTRFEDPALKEKMSNIMSDRWTDPAYRQHMIDIRQTSEGWLNRDWAAIGAKAAAGRKANGTDKRTPEQRKKISETRKAKFASGELVPYNKGTRKPKPVYTEEEKLQRKLDGIAKSKATKAAMVANGWVNPRKGTAKQYVKKKDDPNWINPIKGKPKSKEAVANRVASRLAKNEERRLAGLVKPRPKMSEETKEKISKKRIENIASGKITPWKKGKKETPEETSNRMKKYYITKEKNKLKKG